MASLADAIIMRSVTKKVRHRIFIPLICGGVFIILYVLATFYLESKIEKSLASIHGKASSISVYLFSRSLSIHGLELYPSSDAPYSSSLKELHVSGVNLYELLVNKKIIVTTVTADSGSFRYDRAIKKNKENTRREDFTFLLIKNISLNNIRVEIRTDTIVDLSTIFHCAAEEMLMNADPFQKPVYSVRSFEVSVEKTNISRHSGMYGGSVGSFYYNSKEEKVIIDSALLIPNYSKFDFAHRKGEQVGRVNISVPRMVIGGIALEEIMDSTFAASGIEINSFEIHSFKDKRVPFLRTYNIPLPMEGFLKLPFTVSADSLVIKDSRILIEEISEKGSESGTITIENVNASCSGFSNRNKKTDPPNAILNATGFLMGSGKISAVFQFPLDGSPTYSLKGSISNLPFKKLNPALENLVRIRIDSGHLNNLAFDFQYTDLRSVGTLEINYENLRLIGLNKKNGANEIKTLLLNAFIADDKTRLSNAKKTGKIDIERDRKRYIFNVWWKSILGGLRSTVLGNKNTGSKNGKGSKSKK